MQTVTHPSNGSLLVCSSSEMAA